MIWPASYWISHTVDWLKAQTVTELKILQWEEGRTEEMENSFTEDVRRVRSWDVRFLAAQLEKTHITWTLTHDELRWCERNKWYFRGNCVTSWRHLLRLAPSYSSSHNNSLFSRSRYSYIQLWCQRFPFKTSPLFTWSKKETNLFLLGLTESVVVFEQLHSFAVQTGMTRFFFLQVFTRWRNEDFGGSK